MQKLLEQLKQLNLQSFTQNLDAILNNQAPAREAIIAALEELCRAELAYRRERSVQCRIKEAQFAEIKTIDSFDFTYNASTQKIKHRYLKLLESDFISQGLCVLFVGNTGLGKTHLATALGCSLCQRAERVRYTTIGTMALDLTTSEATGTLKRAMDRYIKPALLVIDEVGYVRMAEQESNLVFQIFSQRHSGRRSTVVTTNQPFGEWNQVFHNDAMAHAILDRLVERSEVFYLEGKSYRETHRKRLDN
jgi:DNA replication protein DnaC